MEADRPGSSNSLLAGMGCTPCGAGNFSRGAGNFPRQGSDFLWQGTEFPLRDRRHEIKPCVAEQYPLIAWASAHYWDTDIRPSQTRREHAHNWQSAVPLMAAAQ